MEYPVRVEIGSSISSLPLPHQRKDKVNFGSFGELETGLKQTPVGYTPLFSSATARVYINSILLIRSGGNEMWFFLEIQRWLGEFLTSLITTNILLILLFAHEIYQAVEIEWGIRKTGKPIARRVDDIYDLIRRVNRQLESIEEQLERK